MPTNAEAPLPRAYDPGSVEDRIYALWEAGGYFRPAGDPARNPFTVIMPPPNVTGALHLGHALTIAIEDVLVRWRRMLGDPTLWLPGIDHAGIATQNVVEAELAREGRSRQAMGREAFLERVWDWVARYRSRIDLQTRRLGASCDWSRLRFTLDPGPQEAVRTTFFRLYRDGKIYRGHRLINWCPRCRTALSDLETEYAEEEGRLWYIRYPFADAAGQDPGAGVIIATTRPETIVADVALAVNPEDARWRHAVGRTVRLPLPDVQRLIPVLADPGVEIGFGTGALKITPGHDPLDFAIGERHGLEALTAIDWDGRMTPLAGPNHGLDRDAYRRKAVEDLRRTGALLKEEPHPHAVGHCHRCQTVVEPLISDQWFVDMDALAGKAAQVVRDGDVRIVPERFSKVYLQWLDNIRPWCISRQLWWGHRIPVWYCLRCDAERIFLTLRGGGGGSVAALTAAGQPYDALLAAAEHVTITEGVTPIVRMETPAADACPHCQRGPLVQDPDVLDTWFSSGLWPYSTLGWPRDSEDLRRFYPGSVMETGYDILFFWVARMVMLSCYNMNGIPPFRTVYLHGLVRDAQGRKMSKSLGNAVDPLEVGAQYGMDALRYTLATGSTPGNDMRLTDERLEGSRNFANKLWNGARFVLGEIGDHPVPPLAAVPPAALALEDRWILSRVHRLAGTVDDLLTQFQIGEAGRQVHDFLWSELFDWYVEASKVRLREGDRTPLAVLAPVLDRGLRLLHPFMPFVTEEIWQHLRPHLAEETAPALIIAAYPRGAAGWRDDAAERAFAAVQDVVGAIRAARAERGVEAGRWIEAYVAGGDDAPLYRAAAAVIGALARTRPLHVITARADAPAEPVVTQVLARAEVILPLGSLVDLDAERRRLRKEITEAEGRLQGLEAKLANTGFRAKAPADVIRREEARREEIRARAEGLRTRLTALG